jgi:glutamyl-Q tRNA(Asp) synthetase
MASYLEARQNNGKWLLRIENIDPPREQAGASRQIVEALDRYGFEWDGAVSYQHKSQRHHIVALQELLERQMAYYCACSRSDFADAKSSSLGKLYPGTCRHLGLVEDTDLAVRVRTVARPIAFVDGLQGLQKQDLEAESGDFVILRKDGLVAYHLAVVVDDHLQNISHIVRGADLMDSTPRQIWLQQLLGFPTPAYAHIPVAVHADGSKLSKLTGANALPEHEMGKVLVRGLFALGQQPPVALEQGSLAEIWRWAMQNWNMQIIAGQKSIRPTGQSRRELQE